MILKVDWEYFMENRNLEGSEKFESEIRVGKRSSIANGVFRGLFRGFWRVKPPFLENFFNLLWFFERKADDPATVRRWLLKVDGLCCRWP
jgi:hypothetical protein